MIDPRSYWLNIRLLLVALFVAMNAVGSDEIDSSQVQLRVGNTQPLIFQDGFEPDEHYVMLRVVWVTPDWVPYSNWGGWTQAVEPKESEAVKYFEAAIIGTSKNAVMTQIWIAMCVYLILAFIKFQSKLTKSMQQILRLLHMNLFEKRDLMALLRGDPVFDNQPDINQMALL